MDYLLITLLGLNLLGVFYVMVKVTFRQKANSNQDVNQTLIENMIKMKGELGELKASIDQQNRMLQMELSRIKPERSPVVEKQKPSIKVKVQEERPETLFLNDRYKEIFDLQQQGLSTEEIAKKLKKGYSEVELILQLAGKRR